MKLKKPITLTIEDADVTMALWLFLYAGPHYLRTFKDARYYDKAEPLAELLGDDYTEANHFLDQITQKLNEIDFSPYDYIPEKKIRVAGRKVEFTPTGIKVGCTEVPKETILEIAKRFQ